MLYHFKSHRFLMGTHLRSRCGFERAVSRNQAYNWFMIGESSVPHPRRGPTAETEIEITAWRQSYGYGTRSWEVSHRTFHVNTIVQPLQETNSNLVTGIYKIVRCMKSHITKLLHFKTCQNKKAFPIIRSNLTTHPEYCMHWTAGSNNCMKCVSIYIPGMQAC